MSYQFTISPDFNSNQLTQWYIFNTRLSKFLDAPCHLELMDDFHLLQDAVRADKVDIIYANASEAAFLIREKGFIPVAQVSGNSDEALVAVSSDSPIQKVSDLQPGTKIAATESPDIEMIGRILIEPAELDRSNTELTYKSNYVLVAKSIITGESHIGFFLKDSFKELADLTRSQLRPIISSHIYIVRHALLVSPKLAEKHEPLLLNLINMKASSDDKQLLEELGIPGGWAPMEQEDAELMIDIMDTLTPA